METLIFTYNSFYLKNWMDSKNAEIRNTKEILAEAQRELKRKEEECDGQLSRIKDLEREYHKEKESQFSTITKNKVKVP